MAAVEIDTRFNGYDIIGDVHGCAHTLELLLDRLGYQKIAGVYRHRHRQAIFVGDILDRGPRIREALHIVRDMVELGFAQVVMGNHEYNAIGYTTKGRPGSGHTYLREHNDRHTRLIAETLEQFANHPEDWQGFLSWFQEMPLFLEMPGFRVVHACWDKNLIAEYKQRYKSNTVDLDFIHQSAVKNSFAGRFMDRLTRGTDMPLPDGHVMTSHEGYERHFFRTRFWGAKPETYGEAAFQPDPLPASIAASAISPSNQLRICTYEESEPPLFIGHYWLDESPQPLAPNVACLDYSAVKYGRLAAYRFDNETTLSKGKFEWVYVDASE